jgi:glycosyltransferase involved in cell wall biosynthesis
MGVLSMERVGVVVTTRDRPIMLARALSSLLAQTRQPDQIVVVDDGGSEALTLPDGVQLVRLDVSAGVCVARNVGLEHLETDAVMFLDDDDWLDTGFFSRAFAAARNSALPGPVAVLGTRVIVEGEAGGKERIRIRPLGRTLGDSWLASPQAGIENTLLAPVDVVRRMGGHDPQFIAWERDDFFERLLAHCSLDVAPDAVYFSDDDPDRPRMTTDWCKMAIGIDRTMRKYCAVMGEHPAIHARYLRSSATHWSAGNESFTAWMRAVAALRRAPLDRRTWKVLGIVGIRSLRSATTQIRH